MYLRVLEGLQFWPKQEWELSDNQEGDTKLSGEDRYYKTFYFFSGSVINRSEWDSAGYQAGFDWALHFHQMYYQEIVYPIKQTYTLTSVSRQTYDWTAAGGDVVTNEQKEFEWVETHLNPAVETKFVNENVYIQPGSVGIAGQTGEEASLRYDLTAQHAHEMAYTDNPLLNFNYLGESDSALDVAISTTEEDFLFSIFGYETDDVTAALEIAIDNLGASIFGLLDVNRYAYENAPEDKLIPDNGGIL